MRIKFVSDGTSNGTMFVNAQTGEKIEWITKAELLFDPNKYGSMLYGGNSEDNVVNGEYSEVITCRMEVKVIIGNAECEANLEKINVFFSAPHSYILKARFMFLKRFVEPISRFLYNFGRSRTRT